MRFCFLSRITFQLASYRVFRMASLPNTSCVGDAFSVVCTVVWHANLAAAIMPCHGRSSSNSPKSSVNVRMMLPIVWWHRSTIEFACGFLLVMCLIFIP